MRVSLLINGAEHVVNCNTFEIISLDGKSYDAGMHGMEMLRYWFKGGRGRMTGLAEHLGISKAAFASWKEIPRQRVAAISEFTGLPERVLRPDHWSE